MRADQLIPAMLESFKRDIKPLKGQAMTPALKASALELIQHYAGRLQLLDLSLSEGEARQVLATAYKSI